MGSAVCRALLRGGARVAFTYHRRPVDLPGAEGFAADLSRFDDASAVVGKAASALGGLDVLVQCAGAVGADSQARLADIDEAELDAMLALTVKSTFAAVRAALEPLSASKGRVILVGSLDGLKPLPSPVHYAAAKGALLGMTGALAQELGPKGILVNLVALGLLEGGMSGVVSKAKRDDYVKHASMRRAGSAAEAAELVDWLARDNTYVTGQAFVLDGGL